MGGWVSGGGTDPQAAAVEPGPATPAQARPPTHLHALAPGAGVHQPFGGIQLCAIKLVIKEQGVARGHHQRL